MLACFTASGRLDQAAMIRSNSGSFERGARFGANGSEMPRSSGELEVLGGLEVRCRLAGCGFESRALLFE
jgi:hypothetical protein